MSRARSCRCEHPKAERREDGKGATIAVTCNRCHRYIAQRCRVCLRDYRDLQLHLVLSECGPFDKAGMWWTADRPPWAGREPPPEQRNLTLPGM